METLLGRGCLFDGTCHGVSVRRQVCNGGHVTVHKSWCVVFSVPGLVFSSAASFLRHALTVCLVLATFVGK